MASFCTFVLYLLCESTNIFVSTSKLVFGIRLGDSVLFYGLIAQTSFVKPQVLPAIQLPPLELIKFERPNAIRRSGQYRSAMHDDSSVI